MSEIRFEDRVAALRSSWVRRGGVCGAAVGKAGGMLGRHEQTVKPDCFS